MSSCTQRCIIHHPPASATHSRTISSTPGHLLYRHPFSTMTFPLIQCPRDVTFSLQATSTHTLTQFLHPLSGRTTSSSILAHDLNPTTLLLQHAVLSTCPVLHFKPSPPTHYHMLPRDSTCPPAHNDASYVALCNQQPHPAPSPQRPCTPFIDTRSQQ
jgi:hypothetical protein